MAPSRWARAALIFVVLPCSAAEAASASITEPDAVRLFLEQSPRARRVPLIEQAVGAERRQAALLSNPEVDYQIEDAAGVRDEFLTVRQELPIGGRRKLRRESADVAASAAGLLAERDLLAATFELRASFYEVLYRARRLDLLRTGTERLSRIVDVLARREREGEGSGYDVLRAEQELAELAISVSEAEAALSVARSRFGSFFGPERKMESARLRGDLEPAAVVPEPEAAVEQALARRGDLTALRADARRIDLELRAARRQRLPVPTLTAGWKRTEAVGVDETGFVAALTLPLPVFDRGRVAAARATAERERIELEVRILEREIRGRVQAALARERAARQAAGRHGEDVERRAKQLRGIAELAYDEGEAGILELLDAYRTSLATELRALNLRYEARRSAIDRARTIGIEVKR